MITAKSNASQRTKNRVREHDLESMGETSLGIMQHVGKVMLLCRDRKDNQYFCWLPVDEIKDHSNDR